MELTAEEIRVLGCLVEKQRTTPDQYPLSLNALRLACNQSTNRDPVVDYDEATVREAVHGLTRRRLARVATGGRAVKYRHLVEEALGLGGDEVAILAVLLLRGPQTPGELKARTERLHSLTNLAAVQATLERLIGRELAIRLERRPGQKEERFVHLLGVDAERAATEDEGGDRSDGRAGDLAGRVERVEADVRKLREELDALRDALDSGRIG